MGLIITSSAVSGGATITDDTTTNATRYLVFEDVTSGTMSTVGVSSTKLQYNPSTGTVTSTDFNSTSDITLKTNLERLSNPSDILQKINGYSFDWKDGSGSSYGVVAQEVEQVLPNSVKTDTTKSVNYSSLIPVLIEALKEQTTKIDQLETLINTLTTTK